MISFRYHVVSLVAVLLALAVGVALGGGPLSEIGRGSDEASAAKKDSEQLADDLDEAKLVSGFQDDVNATLGGTSTKNALKGRSVTILTLPGASGTVVKALGDQVKRAGGSTGGTYAVSEKLLATDGSSLVDTLGAQLAEANDGAADPAATTYVRMGELIRRATSTTVDAGSEVDKGAENIRSGLEAAKLFTTSSGGGTRGSLVLVVTGDDAIDEGADKILAGLFLGLTKGSDGVVVTGSTDSPALASLREDGDVTAAVSTVDSVQSGSGQLAAVLALAAEGAGGPGAYGVHGKDGALPRG